MLEEDRETRERFDQCVAETGGNALLYMAQALEIWSAMNPAQGSLSMLQAVMSNELLKMSQAALPASEPARTVTVGQGERRPGIPIGRIREFLARRPNQPVPHEYAESLLELLDEATSSAMAGPSDDEIQQWADRHDLKGGATDLRCAFDDAASWTKR